MAKYKQKSIMAGALTKDQDLGTATFGLSNIKKKKAVDATGVMPIDTPSREVEGIKMAKKLRPPKKERYPVGSNVDKVLMGGLVPSKIPKKKKVTK